MAERIKDMAAVPSHLTAVDPSHSGPALPTPGSPNSDLMPISERTEPQVEPGEGQNHLLPPAHMDQESVSPNVTPEQEKNTGRQLAGAGILGACAESSMPSTRQELVPGTQQS